MNSEEVELGPGGEAKPDTSQYVKPRSNADFGICNSCEDLVVDEASQGPFPPDVQNFLRQFLVEV